MPSKFPIPYSVPLVPDRLSKDLVHLPVECAEIAKIVVATPLDPDQPLQSDAVIEWDDVVLCSVKEIDEAGDLPDPAVVSQRISQEHRDDRPGQERVSAIDWPAFQ